MTVLNWPLNTPSTKSDTQRESRLASLRRSVRSYPLYGWCADLIRTGKDALWLNLQKTLYRYSKGRSKHPCSSGWSKQARCTAVSTWADPYRFRRRICPLLKQGSDGHWQCSVAPLEIRPFWGLAARHAAVGTATFYLVATLTVFAFLRTVGFPVRYLQVAWPLSWQQVEHVRSETFFAKAKEHLSNRDGRAGFMYLEQGYELDPSNYEAGMLIAQLMALADNEAYNERFRELIAKHPDRRNEIALAWFHSVMTHGNFTAMEIIAQAQLPADPSQLAYWVNVFLLANRHTHHDKALLQVASDTRLPRAARDLFQDEWDLRMGDQNEAIDALVAKSEQLEDLPAYAIIYRINRLLAFGKPSAALALLNRSSGKILPLDRDLLRLDVFDALGWQFVLEGDVEHFLRSEPRSRLIGLMCSHLIRHPNRELVMLIAKSIKGNPLPKGDDTSSVYAALGCAAGACSDWKLMEEMSELFRSSPESAGRSLSHVELYMMGKLRGVSVSRCLVELPSLPPAVDYAMFDYADNHPEFSK